VELTYSLALNRDGKRLSRPAIPGLAAFMTSIRCAPRMLDPAFNASSTWAGSRVRGVAISADGSRFVDGEAVFSPDGKRLLAREFPLGGNPSPSWFPIPATGKAVGSFKAVEAAFSPDSSLIACGLADDHAVRRCHGDSTRARLALQWTSPCVRL